MNKVKAVLKVFKAVNFKHFIFIKFCTYKEIKWALKNKKDCYPI